MTVPGETSHPPCPCRTVSSPSGPGWAPTQAAESSQASWLAGARLGHGKLGPEGHRTLTLSSQTLEGQAPLHRRALIQLHALRKHPLIFSVRPSGAFRRRLSPGCASALTGTVCLGEPLWVCSPHELRAATVPFLLSCPLWGWLASPGADRLRGGRPERIQQQSTFTPRVSPGAGG